MYRITGTLPKARTLVLASTLLAIAAAVLLITSPARAQAPSNQCTGTYEKIQSCIQAIFDYHDPVTVRVTEPSANDGTLRVAFSHNYDSDDPIVPGSNVEYKDIDFYVYGWHPGDKGDIESAWLTICGNGCSTSWDEVNADGWIWGAALIEVTYPGTRSAYFFVNGIQGDPDQNDKITFESNWLDDCLTGRNADGHHWRLTGLTDHDRSTTRNQDLQHPNVGDCAGKDSVLPGRDDFPDSVWQAQVCNGNNCASPKGITPSQFDGDYRFFPASEFTPLANQLEDAEADPDNTYITYILQRTTWGGSVEEFRDGTVPYDKTSEEYGLFTVCEGLLCQRPRALKGTQVEAALPREEKEPEAPTAPRSVSARINSEKVLTVTWSTPSSSGASSIKQYEVSYQCDDLDAPTGGAYRPSGNRRYEITIREYLIDHCGTGQTTVTVMVRAASDDGIGPWSTDTVNTSVPEPDPDPTPQPTPTPEPNDPEDSGSHGSPSGDTPVSVTTDSQDHITVRFNDDSDTACNNYYIESWGAVGHLHRAGTSPRATVTLPDEFVATDGNGRYNKNRIDVLCGTFTDDDHRGYEYSAITKEEPDGSGQRWVGSYTW